LKPLDVNKVRGDGQTMESPASSALVGEFRSLVAAIAWLGITSPIAQAGASLYQHLLPSPLIKHVHMLNAFLAQLHAEYTPLVYRTGFDIKTSKLLVTADSSLGNADRYSQGGHLIWPCEDLPDKAAGRMLLLANRSSRSKRVASSTMSAECLAMCSGVEEATLLQTWLYEISHGHLSARQLLQVPPSSLNPMDCATDCNDLYSVLIAPAPPAPTNKSLTLFLSSLRADHECKRVRAWIWLDTADMLANPLTKLESKGTLDWTDLRGVLQKGSWQPTRVWKWNGIAMGPGASRFSVSASKSITQPSVQDKSSRTTPIRFFIGDNDTESESDSE
jgi:hypothetical protein